MEPVLNESNPIEYYFARLSAIPRPSGHEKAVSDYVVSVAKAHDLRYYQDELYNVVVYKPAYPGYESHPVTMLQAHLDMVPAQTTNSEHDWEKDPVELIRDKNILKAKDTSLGADDGYGCAYMLAILTDPDIQAPALECVFTTNEETGTDGAKYLNKAMLHSHYMIGLDTSREYSMDVGCFTSSRVILKKTYIREQCAGLAYHIHIRGLNGNVMDGVANPWCSNALKILARILWQLKESGIPYRLIDIRGGKAENISPTEGEAMFYLLNGASNLTLKAHEIITEIVQEYDSDRFTGSMEANLFQSELPAMTLKDTEQLVSLLYLLPNNLIVSSTKDGSLSCNNTLGILLNQYGHITVQMSTRSKYPSLDHEITSIIHRLADLHEFSYKQEKRYSSWAYNPRSVLRSICNEVLKEETGKPFEQTICPGGLEIAIFTEEMPGLDAVELGVKHEHMHSTEEYMDLDSFNRQYVRLKKILARL